jgi:hypothetical protein
VVQVNLGLGHIPELEEVSIGIDRLGAVSVNIIGKGFRGKQDHGLGEGFQFLKALGLLVCLVLFGVLIHNLGEAFEAVNDGAETQVKVAGRCRIWGRQSEAHGGAETAGANHGAPLLHKGSNNELGGAAHDLLRSDGSQ